MKVPYIRLAKGLPTEAAQRQALRDVGVPEEALADAYVDRVKLKSGELTAWAYLLGAIRETDGEPDHVCIARPAVLAPTEQQARERLAELAAQGGVLFVASTGRTYRWHPDAAEGIAFATAVYADTRALVMEKARGGIKKLGRQHYTPQQWKEAKALWLDPDVTVEAAASRSGIGMRSLYRRFGPKGTPAFGRVKRGQK